MGQLPLLFGFSGKAQVTSLSTKTDIKWCTVVRGTLAQARISVLNPELSTNMTLHFYIVLYHVGFAVYILC